MDKLRFFIIDEKNRRRSSVWDVFKNNDSLYVCPQNTGGSLKLSLHPDAKDSKNSQMGIKNDYKLKIEAEGYFSPNPVRWLRPVASITEVTKVASIFFPTDFLRSNIKDRKHPSSKKKIKFAIPIAKSGESVEINLFYTLNESEKIEKLLMENLFTLLGSFQLKNGERVLITARHVKFDSNLFPNLHTAKINPLPGAPKKGESFSNLHMILFSDPKENHPIFLAEANGLTVKKEL